MNHPNMITRVLFLLGVAALSLQQANAADSVTTSPPPVFQNGNTLPKPHPDNAPPVKNFLRFYNQHVKVPLPGNLTAKDIIAFPSDRTDTVHPAPDHTTFVTANLCADCHDGTVVKAKSQPAMTFTASDRKLLANWSVYGEWRGTLMALSGRDPVFHAQVETERIKNPGLAPVIDDICFSCHASMGQRQINTDKNKLFSNCMMYSTLAGNAQHPTDCKDLAGPEYATYGMQGRDGISCSMCHAIGPSDGKWRDDHGKFKWEIFYGKLDKRIPGQEDPPGPPYRFTSSFQYNLQKLYVPNKGIDKTQRPMQMLGLSEVEQSPYLRDSILCASCHVVIVPKIPAGDAKQVSGNAALGSGLAYEQTTFFEWMNSSYGYNAAPGKAVQCQGCHMPGIHVAGSAHPDSSHVVSLGPQWNVPIQPRRYARHIPVGSNLFTTEMFAQFSDILGITRTDNQVPSRTADAMTNAEEMYLETGSGGVSRTTPPAATISITRIVNDARKKKLTAVVGVTNNTGHKFPSGINLRRAFIEFDVLDKAGKILWSSGRTNQQGAIIDGSGRVLKSEFTKDPKQLQPNYKTITQQNQVQIYELRNSNQQGELTTQVLRLFHDIKDNRILPQGWKPSQHFKPTDAYLGLNMQTIARVTAPHSASDLNYSGEKVAYHVDLSRIKGKPAKVRAAIKYQATPPYYLADRFNDGVQETGQRGANTERLIYLSSRLNTNLNLSNVGKSRPKFKVIKDWTVTINVAERGIK